MNLQVSVFYGLNPHVLLVTYCVGVPRDIVVKCLTHNLGALSLIRTGSSGFFHGCVLGQDTSEPKCCTGETQE